eukprot:5613404-Pyramimonas_sp.AAC.1
MVTLAKNNTAPSMIMQCFSPAIMGGRALRRAAWCATHRKHCCLTTADCHAAGTSCTDFSLIRDQNAEAGINMVYPGMAWTPSPTTGGNRVAGECREARARDFG